jgi:hypothetical protein
MGKAAAIQQLLPCSSTAMQAAGVEKAGSPHAITQAKFIIQIILTFLRY